MIITFIILAIIVFYIIFAYNSAVSAKETVVNSYKRIGVQLDARGKTIDSLVNLTNKYEIHERDIFLKLAELRASSNSATNIKDKKHAEEEIDKIIESDAKDANALGVKGTPTIFVNEKKLNTLSQKELFDLVETEIYK